LIDIEKYKELENIINDKSRILYNEPMKKHTTVKVGGNADVVLLPINVDEIKNVLNFAREKNIPYYIIGSGSNLLVTDDDVHALIIKLTNKFGRVYVNEDIITVDAGAAMPYVASIAKKNSLAGFEFASGIPGTIGGGVRMNAGAYGSCIEEIFLQATYIDDKGNICVLNKEEMKFGYRHSFFLENPNFIIVSAKFRLKKGKIEEIEEKMNQNKLARIEKQPLDYPNFGSVFKRPEGFFVGKLVTDAGLKGYTIGGAQVSNKHAGFIINTGNATCRDIVELIKYVQKEVYDKFKVNL
jgi:UDP-N-acetylmuramate dehydrogenase